MRAVICSLWTWPIDSLPICGIGIKLHSVNETMIDLYNNLQLQLCSAYIFLPWLLSIQCLSKLDT